MNTSTIINNNPVRHIRAKVEHYSGSTLAATYNYTDALKSITIERVGEESKFFGFGVCQKANIKLLDVKRTLTAVAGTPLKIYFAEGFNNYTYVNNFPNFYISTHSRDENTNELSITAYDVLYNANSKQVAELELESYTVIEFVEACASLLGLSGVRIEGATVEESCFNIYYPTGANFEGTETIREALNAAAEVTQTIYYVSGETLVLKRLGADSVLTIDKDNYFTLTSRENRRLSIITSATELGENLTISTGENGTTQYIRDNPFLELREDIETLLTNAIEAVGGLTINQFECDWRGNYLLEIGDKITLITKDDKTVTSYILDDVIEYDGSLKEVTQWSYTDNDNETATTPVGLGELVKQTYAKVDKVNKKITIVASESSANKDAIASLQINTENINASVTNIEERTAEAINGLTDTVETLTSKVSASITADDVKIQIENELENGVGKVVTSTGFVFDETGLTVKKSGSEIETQITENGMQVFKENEAVLTANNDGVNAANLHATTYLIIGNNSRIEDYNGRTGCFWIGG